MLLNSKIVNKGSKLKPFSLFSVNGGLITEKDVMKADWDVVAKLHWENVYKPALNTLKH